MKRITKELCTKFVTLFATFLLAITSLCFGNQAGEEKLGILQEILNNHHTCVKSFAEDRVYLMSENIRATENGVFLILNEGGDFIQIPQLLSDVSGCYVAVPSDSFEIFNRCPDCGESYFVVCRNPRCPRNKK